MSDRPILAHLGIFVIDISMMAEFYTDVFGLLITDRGVGKTFKNELVFLSGAEDQHHQLVLSGGRSPDWPSTVMQLSFKVPTLAALRDRLARAERFPVTGKIALNHGNAWSVYFNDPEGNRIEIYLDTIFHTPQPCGEPLDLDLDEETLIEQTRKLVDGLPGSMPRDRYVAQMKEKLS